MFYASLYGCSKLQEQFQMGVCRHYEQFVWRRDVSDKRIRGHHISYSLAPTLYDQSEMSPIINIDLVSNKISNGSAGNKSFKNSSIMALLILLKEKR